MSKRLGLLIDELNTPIGTMLLVVDLQGNLRAVDWNPYDGSVTSALAWTKSEAEQYDVKFPQHPLSRLRRLLRQLQLTLNVDRYINESLRSTSRHYD